MITLEFILKNKELFLESVKKRFYKIEYEVFINLDKKRKDIILKTQELQEKKNTLAKEFAVKKQKNESTDSILKESEDIKNVLPKLELEQKNIEEEIKNTLLQIPNILQSDVPNGETDADNIEIKKWGSIPTFNFTPKEHFDLLPQYLDFETAAKISGSRFVILKDKLSKLERALVAFCLNENSKHEYIEHSVPFLTLPSAFVGTSQLPKFEGDFFQTTTGHFLIPTSEVPLTNMVSGSILEESELPIRLTAQTPCFRSEAGSAGKDTRGMIRQHQFTKVELVTICKPEESEAEHIKMLQTSENILQKLGLPYRIVLLCGGDIGFSASKTYDIEVWLPGQGKFREIASISNTLSFQAVRMNARFKNQSSKKNEFVHTLNGSSLAIGRLIVAIMENFQTSEGRVKIPEALSSLLPFTEI